MEEDCVLDSVFSSYDAFDRQAPAAEQQQAQPMVDALGSVQGAAEVRHGPMWMSECGQRRLRVAEALCARHTCM